MYPTAAPVRRFLLPLLASMLVASLCLPVQAADRLAEHSIITDRADNTLLLDIVIAGERAIAAGDQGVILYSDDKGTNWHQAAVPFSVMLTALDFPTPEEGWVVGHDGLIARSQNGGQNWQKVMDGRVINELRVERLTQLYSELEQQVELQPDNDDLLDQLDILSYQLEDAQIALEDGPSVPLLDIWFVNQKSGFILGGYGLLLRTDDGGDSWQYWGDRLPNPDGFHLNSMTRDHSGAFYIAGEAGQIFRSSDQGMSWELLDSPYEGSFFAVSSLRQQLYLLGLRGHLFTSSDGFDWQPVDIPTDKTLTAAVPDDGDLLLLGQGGTVLSGKGKNFRLLDNQQRRSFSAGVALDDGWLLVGEQGVMRLTADITEADHE